MSFVVYGLVDPRTCAIRYIGQSVRGMARAAEHRWPSSSCENTRKLRWVKALLAAGKEPVPILLEECETKAELDEAERRWIAKIPNLTNMTAGGDGGWSGRKHTRRTLKKMSKVAMGRALSAVTKENIRAKKIGSAPTKGFSGRHHSEGSKKAISTKNAGKSLTAEHREKIAAALKGRAPRAAIEARWRRVV